MLNCVMKYSTKFCLSSLASANLFAPKVNSYAAKNSPLPTSGSVAYTLISSTIKLFHSLRTDGPKSLMTSLISRNMEKGLHSPFSVDSSRDQNGQYDQVVAARIF